MSSIRRFCRTPCLPSVIKRGRTAWWLRSHSVSGGDVCVHTPPSGEPFVVGSHSGKTITHVGISRRGITELWFRIRGKKGQILQLAWRGYAADNPFLGLNFLSSANLGIGACVGGELLCCAKTYCLLGLQTFPVPQDMPTSGSADDRSQIVAVESDETVWFFVRAPERPPLPLFPLWPWQLMS